nr:probable inactive histone-lysine N-methyltransferase SUVR2 [Ipomoea batatas]
MRHMSMQKDDDDEKKLASVHNTDLNFMSKRKVPNGPDPIHNRMVSIRRKNNSRKRLNNIPCEPSPSPLNYLMRQVHDSKESATMVHVSCDDQPIDDAATNELNEEVALMKPKQDIMPQEVAVSSANKGGSSSNASPNDKPSIIELAMASSPSGQVRLVVDCTRATEKIPNYQVPSLDTVVNSLMMEEGKYLKKLKDANPNFSVKILMENICQCFLEMNAKSTSPTCSSSE